MNSRNYKRFQFINWTLQIFKDFEKKTNTNIIEENINVWGKSWGIDDENWEWVKSQKPNEVCSWNLDAAKIIGDKHYKRWLGNAGASKLKKQ